MTSQLLTPYFDQNTQSVIDGYLGLDEYAFLKPLLSPGGEYQLQLLWSRYKFIHSPTISWTHYNNNTVSPRFREVCQKLVRDFQWRPPDDTPFETRFVRACHLLKTRHDIVYVSRESFPNYQLTHRAIFWKYLMFEHTRRCRLYFRFERPGEQEEWEVMQCIFLTFQQAGIYVEWKGATYDDINFVESNDYQPVIVQE